MGDTMTRTTKNWAEAERFLDQFRGQLADHIHRAEAARREISGLEFRVAELEARAADPVPMLIWCPECGARHIDEGEFATKVHHTHACQTCGHCWRPAVVATCGIRFLPGFKNEDDRNG